MRLSLYLSARTSSVVPSSYFTTTHPSVWGFFFQRSSASRPSTEPTMMGFLNSSSAGLSRSKAKELPSETESAPDEAESEDSDESELPSLKKESSEDEPESAVPVSEDSANDSAAPPEASELPESVSETEELDDSLKLAGFSELLSLVNSVSSEPDSEDSELPSLKKEAH